MSGQRNIERLADLEPSLEEFRESVLGGLSTQPKNLPCKYFYDAEGSRLFDRICELTEYYPTRTECRILAERAPQIAALAGPQARVVEFGSGAGTKIRLLLSAFARPACYVPVDISRTPLLGASADLARTFPALRIQPICADYTRPFSIPTAPGGRPLRNVGFFPGSTIGNFTPAEATEFLRTTLGSLGPGSLMIVGVDIPKSEDILHAAYDDPSGVTAAFNLNLLRRINRELGGTFDIAAFSHRAVWNRMLSRIEMHLVSRARQIVRVGEARFAFKEGETIHTENSYKFDPAAFRAIATQAGYTPLEVWCDAARLFSVHVLVAA